MTTLALSKRGNTQGATHPSEDVRKQAGITNGCQSNASVRDESIYPNPCMSPQSTLFRRKTRSVRECYALASFLCLRV